jgi:hypothetical protein
MDRETLFKTVLPMTGAIILGLAFTAWYHRYFSRSTERAHQAFDRAIRAMVEHFHLTYYPPSGPNDWPQAGGSYRGHTIGFLIVSESESPMRTGLIVSLQRPLPTQVLARLKARRGLIKRGRSLEVDTPSEGVLAGLKERFGLINRGRSLEVDTSAHSDGVPLPPYLDTLLGTLLAGAYDVRIGPDQIFVQLETRWNTFFNFDMLTDPDKLLAQAETALDVATVLEAVDA